MYFVKWKNDGSMLAMGVFLVSVSLGVSEVYGTWMAWKEMYKDDGWSLQFWNQNIFPVLLFV